MNDLTWAELSRLNRAQLLKHAGRYGIFVHPNWDTATLIRYISDYEDKSQGYIRNDTVEEVAQERFRYPSQDWQVVNIGDIQYPGALPPRRDASAWRRAALDRIAGSRRMSRLNLFFGILAGNLTWAGVVASHHDPSMERLAANLVMSLAIFLVTRPMWERWVFNARRKT